MVLSENPATKFLINQAVSTSFKLVKRKPNEGLNRAKKPKKTMKKKRAVIIYNKMLKRVSRAKLSRDIEKRTDRGFSGSYTELLKTPY